MPYQPRLIKDESAAYIVPNADKAAYQERLRQLLQDPAFRQIEGFPIGEDEDILALSDLPYYTACPNPFLAEIITEWQQERANLRQQLGLPDDNQASDKTADGYHREPFAADVSEGKNDPIYNAHSYHTKVPHKAIMRYILHYTDPGDVLFDGFCGTGMTGVAAQLCGDKNEVESLGYRVDDDGSIYDGSIKISQLGTRNAIICDLSVLPTFIAANLNGRSKTDQIEIIFNSILREAKAKFNSLFETSHINGEVGTIEYTVWSDVFICSNCLNEVAFWDGAIDLKAGEQLDPFPCPHCRAMLRKRSLERVIETIFDPIIGELKTRPKRIPVWINYSYGGKRYNKCPLEADLSLAQNISAQLPQYWFPTSQLPKGDRFYKDGLHLLSLEQYYQFYFPRTLITLSYIWEKINSFALQDDASRNCLKFILTSMLDRNLTIRNRFVVNRHNPQGRVNGPLANTLYVPGLSVEQNPLKALKYKSKYVLNGLSQSRNWQHCAITTQSTTDVELPEKSVDYIFIDPPFGKNIMYAELNGITESWLRVNTNNRSEAIVSDAQKKTALEYMILMAKCFKKCYQVLKPGRWITVEFHNSQSSIWNAIQEALNRAGFVIADVRTLDKRKGTINQEFYSQGAVKQDLVISAYKPNDNIKYRLLNVDNSIENVWDFVVYHLEQLPVVVEREGKLEIINERQDYLLYDRMVAFHIHHGLNIPLSAPEFYDGLRQRFAKRNGMFFLSEQVPQYDRAALKAQHVAQLSFFVSDEKSAIQWLRQHLDTETNGQPQTYQQIQPQFLRQLHQAPHEALPELSTMLEENFLQDDAGKWYVPDPNEESDLQKLRLKALLREFKGYVEGNGRLRQFRTEAIRAGFAAAYEEKDYATIIQVGNRLPERVLHEDLNLLMYYDNADLRK